MQSSRPSASWLVPVAERPAAAAATTTAPPPPPPPPADSGAGETIARTASSRPSSFALSAASASQPRQAGVVRTGCIFAVWKRGLDTPTSDESNGLTLSGTGEHLAREASDEVSD